MATKGHFMNGRRRAKGPDFPPEVHRFNAENLRKLALEQPDRADYLLDLAKKADGLARMKEIIQEMNAEKATPVICPSLDCE